MISKWLLAVVVLGVVAAAALAVMKAKLEAAGSKARFRAKPLLTANELEFLVRLEAAVPELRFFPQVAMGAMLEPAVSRSDRRAYYQARGMFSQKIIDYVAQRREDGSVVAVIELDDRTHNPAKDGKRDEMLQSAGYRIIRWNSKAKPSPASIREALLPTSPVGSAPEPGPAPAAAKAAGPRAA